MKTKWLRIVRRGRRYVRRKPISTALLVAGLGMLGIVLVHKQPQPTVVSPQAYTPLLNIIAKGESNGNYNAYYGNGGNTTIRFTDMTVAEVLQWQEEFVRQGSPSSAVGKYQIVRPTLLGLVRQLDIDPRARYDEALQDRLAIALLERRGSVAYVDKELTREQFAANLAREWAALPKVIGDNPQESYYAGDGLNHSRISIEEVFAALRTLANHAGSSPIGEEKPATE